VPQRRFLPHGRGLHVLLEARKCPGVSIPLSNVTSRLS
jgi:hypothetical protein